MSRTASTAPLLVLRNFAPSGEAAAQNSLTIRSADREVFMYETAGEPGCKLVAFDATGAARLTVEVAKEDYSPRIARWMQRCVGALEAK